MAQSPRPLVIHPHLHPRRTGITRHVESVVPELASDFEIATVGRAIADGVPRMSWAQVWRRFRREPAVWHAHRNLELLIGMLLRLFARRLRIVFTRHAGSSPGGYTRLLASRADRVIALTRAQAATLRLPATVVGHGVDLGRFAPPADRAEAWRALRQPGEHGIGVIGRIRPEKGQGDFAEAVSPLLAADPRWHAVFVGRVTPSEEIFAAGLRARLASRLTIVPEQSNILPWYQGLSVVVQPSHSEGYSLALLEAMACGCCVVASALPYTDGLIEHDRTGMLFPAGDAEALRSTLSLLLADPARVAAIGAAAAEEARRRLGVGSEVRALGQLYREVLD